MVNVKLAVKNIASINHLPILIDLLYELWYLISMKHRNQEAQLLLQFGMYVSVVRTAKKQMHTSRAL